MKLLGFILVISSSLLCGVSFSLGKKERIEELRSFAFMLEIIQAELNKNLCPLPELFEKTLDRFEHNAFDFVKVLQINLAVIGEKDFETIWKESLLLCCKKLSEEEVESILMLGSILGKYDLELQISAIDKCIMLLRENEKKDSVEFPALRRLSMAISFSAGMLIAIFLI